MIGIKAIIQLLASFLAGGLSFLILVLSARLFGPEILGQTAYFAGVLGLMFAFTDLGLSRAHVHFTAARGGNPELAGFLVLKLPLLLLAILAAVIWAGRTTAPLVFFILLANEVFFRLADSLLISFEGQERVWPQNLLKTAAKICRLIAVIWLGYQLATSLGYAFTFLIEAIWIFGGAVFLAKSWFNLSFNRQMVKRYLSYSLPLAAIIPLSYLQENSLVLMLNHWQGSAALGVYTAGFGLFGFIKSFSSSLMVYFFPRISRLNEIKDKASIQRYTDLAVKLSFWLLAPLILLLLLFSRWLVPLALGANYLAAIDIFRIYLLGVLLLAIFAPYDHVLFATNHHRGIVKINLLTTLLLLFLGWQLIPRFGGVGAAWANVIAWLVSGWCQFQLLHQKTGLKFLTDWRLSQLELKYLYGLFNSFSQAVFRAGRKKTGF